VRGRGSEFDVLQTFALLFGEFSCPAGKRRQMVISSWFASGGRERKKYVGKRGRGGKEEGDASSKLRLDSTHLLSESCQ